MLMELGDLNNYDTARSLLLEQGSVQKALDTLSAASQKSNPSH